MLTAVVALLALAAPARASQIFPNSPFSSGAAGTTGAAFLKLPTGGREEAMGGAAAADSEGAQAMLWNPAGMARLAAEAPAELALGYSALLDTTYAGSAGYARPLGAKGVIGGGLLYFSQSPQTAYSSVGDSNGSFTPYDLAFNASYARRYAPVLVGGSFKLIRSAVADAAGMSAAVDLGVQAPHVTDVGDGPLDLGAGVNNLGPPIRVGSVSSPLPFSTRMGALWRVSPALNSAVDVVFPVDQDPYVSFGLEGVMKQPGWKGFLRFGYNQSHSRDVDGLSGITGGAGLDLAKFRLDYAWIPFGDLGTTNRIALVFRF